MYRYNKMQRTLARTLAILFILSMMFMFTANFAHASDAAPTVNFTLLDTTGSVPDATSDCYTVTTGDSVDFELDITGTVRPELITLLNVDGLQFQEVTELLAIDRNNQAIPWEYNNTVPMNDRVEINAMGLPDTVHRLVVTYTCTVLEEGVLNPEGLYGQAVYVDNGSSTMLTSSNGVYGLSFQIAATDSSKAGENTPNYLTTGTYSLYYNPEMTRPVRFVTNGNIHQVIAEWDNRGKNFIEIENTGTANIKGLKSGVYYLAQTIAPENYDEYTGIIELELYAKQSGSGVNTYLKILNDSEIQLQPVKATNNGSSLTLDYAGPSTVMRQIQNTVVKNTLPILGLMLVGVGAATWYIRRNKHAHHTN